MRSRYSNLKDITKTLADAEERYYMTQGAYTTDFNALDISVSGIKEGSNIWLLDDKDNTWCYVVACCYIACSNTGSINNGYAAYFRKGLMPTVGNRCFSYGTAEDKYAKFCQDIAGGASLITSAGGCPNSSRGGSTNCYLTDIP